MLVGRFDNAKGLNQLLENFKVFGWINYEFIDSYINFCDEMLISSIWEEFRLVTLETMKNKRMVLASDVGGLSELIENGYNGYKFDSFLDSEVKDVLSKFGNTFSDKVKKFGKNCYGAFCSKI